MNIEVFQSQLRDPAFFDKYCAQFMKIQTKDRGLQPLRFKSSQMKFFDAFKNAITVGANRHFIILKSRQQGFSTLIEALNYWLTTQRQDFRTMIVSYDSDGAEKLYQMFKTYYDHFPAELRPALASPGNEKGLKFKELRSSIRVYTAEKSTAASGGTFQAAHISELAKWQRPEETMLSLMQTLPPSAFVTIESTAYGVGNYFYTMWNQAKAKENDFIPLFFPWWQDEDCRMDKYRDSDGNAYDIAPDREEMYYVDRFGLDQSQINWMRWCREVNCLRDWDTFHQEYPAYEEEAFIASGRPYFDLGKLRDLDVRLMKEGEVYVRGDLDEDGKGNILFTENADGDLFIYEPPVMGDTWQYRYVISADCAEGREVSGTTGAKKKAGDSDFNALVVYDKITRKQVAYSRHRLYADAFAQQMYRLMKWYGGNLKGDFWPFVIVEMNSMGVATVMYLRDILKANGIPLMRMYHRGTMDVNFEPTTDMLGFRTQGEGERAKGKILEDLRIRIAKEDSGIESRQVVSECMTFIRDGNGRGKAQDGRWDDSVMAYALVIEGERKDFVPSEQRVAEKITGWRTRLKKKSGTGEYKSYWSGRG